MLLRIVIRINIVRCISVNKIEITVLSARVLDALSGRGLKAKTVHEFERYGTRRIVKHCLGKGQILYSKETVQNFVWQTFSIAGSRKGFGDPRGTLFFELARLAEARKPSYLLFENVPYVQKCIRYVMYTNQICIAPPKNSGARLFLLCSTVHNMFLLAKG